MTKKRRNIGADELGERFGIGQAKGKIGTGWMALDKEDYEASGQTPEEYAEGWLETDQWQYEAAEYLGVDRNGFAELYRRGAGGDFEGGFVSGYAAVIEGRR